MNPRLQASIYLAEIARLGARLAKGLVELGAAHSDEDIDRTLELAEIAFQRTRQEFGD